MTNLVEISSWDASVYQIATSDQVLGGPGGIANLAAQSLADRSLWIRNRIAAVINQAGLIDGTSDNLQLAEAVLLHTGTISSLRSNVPQPTVPSGKTVVILVRGVATPDDGQSTLFSWSSTSVVADDGLTVINPAGNAGAGRWEVTGLNANALGGFSTAAVQAAIAAAQSNAQAFATAADSNILAIAEAYALAQATSALAAAEMFANPGSLLTDNGYDIMPSGRIEQWGVTNFAAGPGGTAVVFPIAFPTACNRVVMSQEYSGNSPAWGVISKNPTGFTGAGGGFAWSWRATGH